MQFLGYIPQRISIPALPFSRHQASISKPLSDKYIQNPQTLGEKIRNRRLELSLLQKDVAPLLGTNENSVYRWETNKNEPDMKYMPKIIEFLGYFPFEINVSTVGGENQKVSVLTWLKPGTISQSIGY